MIDLDDTGAWSEIRHAYGSAEDIPPLLRAAESLPPPDDYTTEPYYTLWGSLCHQGDVYDASFAALPHVIRILEKAPANGGSFTLAHLAGCIELERRRGAAVPPRLAVGYAAAAARLPEVALKLLSAASSDEDAIISLFAIAACAAPPRPRGGNR